MGDSLNAPSGMREKSRSPASLDKVTSGSQNNSEMCRYDQGVPTGEYVDVPEPRDEELKPASPSDDTDVGSTVYRIIHL
jgi:hypothetical protein